MADLIFNDFVEELCKGNIDLSTDSFIAILLDATYTPDATDHDYSDVSAYELAEENGYETGGKALTVAFDETAGLFTFDASDLTWALATFTWRYLVIIDDTHTDDLLVCLLDPSEAKTGQGDNMNARFHANGIIYGGQV